MNVDLKTYLYMKECEKKKLKETKAKPFLKWAGGKTQLLPEIESHLPNRQITTYVEPFIGSASVLFWFVDKFPNLKTIVLNDYNHDLINVYHMIRLYPALVIQRLKKLETQYLELDETKRAEFYYSIRQRFNTREDTNNASVVKDNILRASLFIFLNKTCFNGLYRVNRNGEFNVPFGKYKNPKICDEFNIIKVSSVLQNVTILSGDYTKTVVFAGSETFYYLDPPYKPISKTSSFNSYSDMPFGDDEQKRLKEFIDTISDKGSMVMLSNSDPEGGFFDELYEGYNINRVLASRSINSKGSSRGKINELLITNY